MALETTTVISKWTGPRTAAGKERSSLNALKHGLTSRRIVLPYENQEEYDALLKDLLDDSQPVGTLEFELVNDIAAAIWRLRRVRHRECDLAEVALGVKTSKQAREEFALMMRYTGAIERELHRAIIRLNQVQELRHKRDERTGRGMRLTTKRHVGGFGRVPRVRRARANQEGRRKDQESNSRRPPKVLAVAETNSPQPLTTQSDFVSSLELPSFRTPPLPSAELTTDNRPQATSN